jgi:hypothetical protein
MSETVTQSRDLFSKFDEIIAVRENLLASGVEDPFSLVMEKVLSPTRAICNGRDTILLGTYNYMGMTSILTSSRRASRRSTTLARARPAAACSTAPIGATARSRTR